MNKKIILDKPLNYCLEFNPNIKIIEKLLESLANPNSITSNGMSPLIISVLNNANPTIIKLLLNA